MIGIPFRLIIHLFYNYFINLFYHPKLFIKLINFFHYLIIIIIIIIVDSHFYCYLRKIFEIKIFLYFLFFDLNSSLLSLYIILTLVYLSNYFNNFFMKNFHGNLFLSEI